MKQIGFKNFRKFADFPTMDLAPISILVGENNAGKSTVVKGILALSDFFKHEEDKFLFSGESSYDSVNKKKNIILSNLKKQKFYFNTSYLAHIGTFKRALYNKAENSTISFYTTIDRTNYTIEVFGDKDNEEIVSGFISRIVLDYCMLGLHIEFDLQKDKAIVTFNSVNVSEDQLDFISPQKRNKAQQFLSSIPHTYELSFNISNYYRRFVPELLYLLKASVEIAISATLELEKTINHIGSEVVLDLNPIPNTDNETIDFLKKYTNLICPSYNGEEWMFILPDSDFLRRYIRIEYLYAHAVSQSVIYSAIDTNDYLSMTIHEFASRTKTEEDYRKAFIKHWMNEFNIGKDYFITSVGGEAHLVKIQNNDGELINLADKGMGTIQLMVLLFRLAITLPKKTISNNKTNKNVNIYTDNSHIIIIEEPEQNLHPMLQSKLADLFYELNKDYGFRFIIETHSEYLVRKAQVLVGEMECKTQEEVDEKNPFKVFYFPSNGIPFDMGMAPTGKFLRSFDEGFFDVAAKLNMEVIRRERKK